RRRFMCGTISDLKPIVGPYENAAVGWRRGQTWAKNVRCCTDIARFANSSMLERWTDRLPRLRGNLTTLREVAATDVYTLFTLFSDPAVTAYMAPPPPTLAKFAGFVAWSQQEREQGHGLCFGIVPDGMTAAVGILQVRSLDSTLSSAEWGFVLSAHFWSTG